MAEIDDIGIALRMKGVSKRYPGTLAVDGVDFAVRAGEVHALIGENGAGKSTLMKILAGAFDDYTGQVSLNNKPVLLHCPAAAKAAGIQMIHQELSLAGPVSIAENVLAGRLPRRGLLLSRGRMIAQCRRHLARLGLEIDPLAPVEELSLHEAQLVEIAKALANAPCILVMDEPTSSLGRAEVSRLFDIIRRLREQGLAIVYISHHLPEVLQIADRVTVLRDGRKVATENIADVTSAALVEMMVGRNVSTLYAERRARCGAVRLVARGLSRWGFFHDVSFQAAAGEIVGLGGLSGAGRSELARSLCGIDPLDAGTIELDGRTVRPRNYREAIAAGLAYLTEARTAQGLALRMTMGENLLSAIIPRLCRFGLLGPRRGEGTVLDLICSLDINPPQPGRMASALSGGNQQKVLLGKWLAAGPKVLILDEPTRGVDVGAKVVIHRAIAALADSGTCIILISSDLPELVGLSDRILIMRRGHLIGRLPRDQADEATVLLAANGEGRLMPA